MHIEHSLRAGQDLMWLKGNLHTHTSNSPCGEYPVEDVAGLYSDRKLRYDFLAITDHLLISDISKVQGLNGMIVYSGVEYKKEAYQTLGINVSSYNDDGLADGNHQSIFDDVNRQGGMNVVCHPHIYREDYWPLDRLLALEGYSLLEIFNFNVKMNNAGRAVASDVWDALLNRGKKIYGIASDDFHHYNSCAGGFIMVQAKEKSAAAILDAIRMGSFYASSGIIFSEINVNGNRINISGPERMPEMRFRFIGNGGRLLAEQPGRKAEYTVRGDEGYIRAEALREDGAMAWTQPFWVS